MLDLPPKRARTDVELLAALDGQRPLCIMQTTVAGQVVGVLVNKNYLTALDRVRWKKA